MEKEIESNGPRSARLAKLRQQRSGIEAERTALRERFDALAALPMQALAGEAGGSEPGKPDAERR